MARTPTRRGTVVLLFVTLVAVLAAGTWLLSRPSGTDERAPAARALTSAAPPSEAPSPTPARPACARQSRKPFVPTTIRVAGVHGRKDVLALPRDAAGIPGIPPLTTAGKVTFAWDRDQGVRPGQRRGNVLLNAHTWPDGSALGNDLLQSLDVKDRIVVRGRSAVLCYRVTEKVVVAAAEGLPRYYDDHGPPRLAIVVCSGPRLGPGQWENRTIWFAAPRA